jgi:hypothetical protein
MSNINPQSIDGTYPIAGQDNNSQGFRDNFTNTVNNFTFSAAELTDLQQNALLKAPLGSVGQTGTPTNDMNYAYLTHAQIKGSVETSALNLTVDVSNNFTVNWEAGHFQSVTITANSTFSFGTWPSANYFTKLRLQVTVSSGTYTLTFPSSVNLNLSSLQGYTTGQVVSLAAGVYVFEFSTVNFGANVAIQDILRNYNVETGGTTGTFSTINATILNVGTPLGNLRVTGNVTGGLGQFAAINSTPIGNAVPSTGVFTTVTTGAVNAAFVGNVGTVITGAGISANTLNISGNVIGGLAQFGAINSTPIGNASASTGTFTTLSASSITNTGVQIETGYQQIKTGVNVAVTVSPTVNRVLLHPPAATVSFGANVTLPNTQVDGTIISISSNVTIAQLAVVTPWVSTSVSPAGNTASVAPGTVSRFMFINADKVWYKIA